MNDIVFIGIILLIITNVAFIKNVLKEYRAEQEKDKEYYRNLK